MCFALLTVRAVLTVASVELYRRYEVDKCNCDDYIKVFTED